MFKRKPKEVTSLLRTILRTQGLETPWLQHRLVSLWDEAIRETIPDADMAEYIIGYTVSKEIRDQTLWVKIPSPTIRAELQMKGSALTACLNNKVGAHIISSIRFSG